MSEAFVSRDPGFAQVIGTAPVLRRVISTDAHEGPVYRSLGGDGVLYVTTRPGPGRPSHISRLSLDCHGFALDDTASTVQTDAVMPNGMTMGPDGRLIVCEQGDLGHDACISSVDPDSGQREVLVSGSDGRPLNSPNDVVMAPNGVIWFTDPSYGHLQGFRPPPEQDDLVHCFDARSGRTSVAADGFDKPNGVAVSPDGSRLYVTDSGANQAAGTFFPDRPHHVVVFDVVDGDRLANRRVLAVTAPGIPDGLKVDRDGRIFVSASSGVLVFAPEGHMLGEIRLPGAVNFTFGGPDRNLFFIAADSAVWVAALATSGPAAPSGIDPSSPGRSSRIQARPAGTTTQPTGAPL